MDDRYGARGRRLDQLALDLRAAFVAAWRTQQLLARASPHQQATYRWAFLGAPRPCDWRKRWVVT